MGRPTHGIHTLSKESWHNATYIPSGPLRLVEREQLAARDGFERRRLRPEARVAGHIVDALGWPAHVTRRVLELCCHVGVVRVVRVGDATRVGATLGAGLPVGEQHLLGRHGELLAKVGGELACGVWGGGGVG